MKAYLSKCEAVIDLHERGFSEDFELFGTNLLWIQEKFFIRPNDFSIVECHHIIDPLKKELVIFGIAVNGSDVKGILMNHYKTYINKTPVVLCAKLKKLSPQILEQEANYIDWVFNQ